MDGITCGLTGAAYLNGPGFIILNLLNNWLTRGVTRERSFEEVQAEWEKSPSAKALRAAKALAEAEAQKREREGCNAFIELNPDDAPLQCELEPLHAGSHRASQVNSTYRRGVHHAHGEVVVKYEWEDELLARA